MAEMIRDSDIPDDDDEWQLWEEIPEDQQKAIINEEMAKLQRKLNAMTVSQQVAHHRHFLIGTILNSRFQLRNPKLQPMPDCIADVFRAIIRRSQIRLLKLREWRETGVYPGSA